MKSEKPGYDGHRSQIMLRIVREVAAELNPELHCDSLGLQSSLIKDAGIDSLGKIELLMRIDQAFGVALPEEEATAAETPADLLLALQNHKSDSHAQGEYESIGQPNKISNTLNQDFAPPHNASTIAEVLEYHAARNPDLPYIHLYEPGTSRIKIISFSNLLRGSMRIAAGLRKRNLAPTQTTAIMLPTGIDYLYSFFGILLAGNIPVPLYPPRHQKQLEEHLLRQFAILKNCRATTLISTPEAVPLRRILKSNLTALQCIVSVDELSQKDHSDPRIRLQENDIAFLQYTSGSTGTPKGVVLSHANLLGNMRAMSEATQIKASDIFVSWLPLYHDMGLIGMLLGSLYHGLPLILLSPASFITRPRRWLRAIHDHKGTISAAPNFAYDLCVRAISANDMQDLNLESWRLALNGAEPINPNTLKNFIQHFQPVGFNPHAMMPCYGLAENSVGLSFPPIDRGYRIDSIQRSDFETNGYARPANDEDSNAIQYVSCGIPIPGHKIRIVDSDNNELGERQSGRVQFQGPSATKGYYKNSEATAQLLHGDWHDSGDYGYLVDGELYLSGRAREMIIRGGRNIYPYELEQAVCSLPAIRDNGAAVFSVSDPISRVESFVIVAETREKNPEKLRELEERISELTVKLHDMKPDDIRLVATGSILRTSSGKIRRGALRVEYEKKKLGKPYSARARMFRLLFASLAGMSNRLVRFLGRWLYSFYAWTLMLLFIPPVWTGVVLLPIKKMRRFYLRFTGRILLFLLGSRLRIIGKENLSESYPLVFVSNHTSYLDSLVIVASIPAPYCFIAKAELRNQFFAGLFLKRLGVEFVDRFNAGTALGDSRRTINQARQNINEPMFFFAEGTFTGAAGLGPFRMGAFTLSAEIGASIIPIALSGVRTALRADGIFFRPSQIQVRICKPIQTGGGTWDDAVKLRQKVRQEILMFCAEPDLKSLAMLPPRPKK